jgi:hypothetical protein
MNAIDQTRCRPARSRLARAGTTALLILPLGWMLAGAGLHEARAQSQTAAPACGASLDSLMSRWDSIGFAEPSKPAQQIVAGRQGYSTNAGQFNFMRQQIRVAARDCESGRDADALQHINTVRGILDHLGRT